MTANPALDAVIEVDGDSITVRRSHDLMRRIESRFGPIWPLQNRIAANQATMDDVAALYELVLAGTGRPMRRSDLVEWVWRSGVARASAGIVPLLTELYVGNDRLAELMAARDMAAADPTTPAA